MSAPLAALTNRETYRGLLFLSSALPFGAVWIAALAAGWGLTIALAITPLVILVLIGFGIFADLAARAESIVARELLRTPIYPARHGAGLGGGLGPLRRARATVADKAFWKAQTYLALRFFAGVPIAIVVLLLIGEGLLLISSPIHYRWVPQDGAEHGIDFGIWQADTLPETLLLIPVGVALVVFAVNLIRPLAALWRRLAYGLLGGTMTDDYRPLSAAQLRRGLAINGIVVAGIAAVLITIWAATTRDYFWPAWPLMVLGLALAIHALVTMTLTRPERLPERLGAAFTIHAGVSVAIAIFLTLIWAMAGGGYFWPIWPALGLAVSVIAHLVVKLMTPRAELERRIDQLTTTRAGAVNAREEELRRIERDLHDGAQARLVALGMSLGLAEQKLATDPARVRHLLAEARQGAREALEELRDLARGIHPPILADRGLGAAVAALAARSPIRVKVSVEGERPPPAVESAAYFVAAEALANASKHANATQVEVRVIRSRGQLVVEVTDDGRGGADPSGSGLSGLRSRVEALDGRLQVVSPKGGPTTVRAELPCE